MNNLVFYGRPLVVFNPADAEHRKLYHEFVKTGSWGHCPYRFIVPDERGIVSAVLQRTMVEYYLKQEFDTKSRKKA